VTRRFRPALPTGLGSRSTDVVPVACIAGAVIIANFPALVHVVTSNPLFINAYMVRLHYGWLPGVPYIDPNAGYTTQALGHLAAVDWLHGHIPWWNPYEGIGAPLAGEMQSGAFFPLTMVLALHQGMLVLQVSIEAITGWSTYALVRRLGVGRTFSTGAGVAFGLCGTYAWLAHAPIRPVVVLPLCLLGVEQALGAAGKHERGGWQLLALALALSVLAGFPETALIDGLFVAWWAVLRIAGPGRADWWRSAIKVVGGAVCGMALSAPLLFAFSDYLNQANTGAVGGGFASVSLPTEGLSQLVLPYSLGPIFGFHAARGTDNLTILWGSVGGFLTATVIAAGLVGLIGRRFRSLRIGLGAWIVVSLVRSYGFSPVVHLLAVVPGIKDTAFYRYAPPSWELAVVVLAALGLDDIARARTPRLALVAGASVTALLAAWSAAAAWSVLTGAVVSTPSHHGGRHLYPLVSLVAALVLLALLAAGGWWAGRRERATGENGDRRTERDNRTRRRGRLLMAGVVGLESVALVGFTYLSAPPPSPLQLGPVAWLQAHLGTYRFVTLGPIQPNYGSYYGIAQANIDDLPAPKGWTDYISAALDPNTPAHDFSGGNAVDPFGLTPAEALTKYLGNYEEVGVRYVVEAADGLDLKGQPFPAIGAASWPDGPRLVYRDSFAEIWQLPLTSPAFLLQPDSGDGSGAGGSCTVRGDGWDQATVNCGHPSVLVRQVEYFPGWQATVNGVTTDVRRDDSSPGRLFQQVHVPAGTTTLRFTYLPPHEDLAGAVALVAALIAAGSLVVREYRRRRTPTRPGPETP
jgi:hypothetical protein